MVGYLVERGLCKSLDISSCMYGPVKTLNLNPLYPCYLNPHSNDYSVVFIYIIMFYILRCIKYRVCSMENIFH